MKKVLIVGLSANAGGIETLFKGLFEIKSDVFEISFLCFGEGCAFQEIFQNNGYNIYYIPTRKSKPFLFNKYVKDFFKKHDQFDYIWVNTSSTSMYQIQYFGKRYTDAKIITHSHGTAFEASSGRIIYMANLLLGVINKRRVISNTDLFFCCSIAAGEALFGKRYIDRFVLIKNAIDIEKYKYDNDNRVEIRKKLGIYDKTVIVGLFGRLAVQKNPIRAIEIFNEYHKINSDSILLCVGDGNLKDDMLLVAERLNISKSIVFLGFRNDVEKLLSAADVIIMPSLFEGLPLGGIEAQTNGLPVLFSDRITEEVIISSTSRRIPLEESNKEWAAYISEAVSQRIDRSIGESCAKENGYDRDGIIEFIEHQLS